MVDLTASDFTKLAKLGRVLAKADTVYEVIVGFDATTKNHEAELAKLQEDIKVAGSTLLKSKIDAETIDANAKRILDDAKAEFKKQSDLGKQEAAKLVAAANTKIEALKADEVRIANIIKAREAEAALATERVTKLIADEQAIATRVAEAREAARKALGL